MKTTKGAKTNIKPGDCKPLERQSRLVNGRVQVESQIAFDAFMEYCKLASAPGQKRTMLKVAQKLQKPHALIKRWSVTWNWLERAIAYDNDLAASITQALKDSKVTAIQNQAAIANNILVRVAKAIELIIPEDLKPRDIAMWADLGIKIQRQIYGEPTEIVSQEVSGKNGAPLQVTIADLIVKANRVLERGAKGATGAGSGNSES